MTFGIYELAEWIVFQLCPFSRWQKNSLMILVKASRHSCRNYLVFITCTSFFWWSIYQSGESQSVTSSPGASSCGGSSLCDGRHPFALPPLGFGSVTDLSYLWPTLLRCSICHLSAVGSHAHHKICMIPTGGDEVCCRDSLSLVVPRLVLNNSVVIVPREPKQNKKKKCGHGLAFGEKGGRGVTVAFCCAKESCHQSLPLPALLGAEDGRDGICKLSLHHAHRHPCYSLLRWNWGPLVSTVSNKLSHCEVRLGTNALSCLPTIH